ncbi:TauD/TfdA family dioxygenase [Altererythrobacter aquiaggeris]|uniref:TauD/TfdA dioxygenase family protein n=1 Tax=Aestuarierythrobacter aquiaggeris TaxID=1898396 RepID=UPI0030169A35
MLTVHPSGASCGASVSGADLSAPLDPMTIREIRNAWLKHRVLAFPDQHLDNDALERFTIAMGGFGKDPFFDPIPGRRHIAAIKREADEKTPLFAENWHSDWSFLARPPAGTCLTALEIPPQGGDTLFSDQIAAFHALPEVRKSALRTLTAIHSARGAYAPDGAYGDKDEGRTMAIRPDKSAFGTQEHRLIQKHPETGEEAIFSCLGYIIGIKGLPDADAFELLAELIEWQGREQFIYRHSWSEGMLVMWDNRSVLHKATGGYEGFRRKLHRTTIAAWDG